MPRSALEEKNDVQRYVDDDTDELNGGKPPRLPLHAKGRKRNEGEGIEQQDRRTVHEEVCAAPGDAGRSPPSPERIQRNDAARRATRCIATATNGTENTCRFVPTSRVDTYFMYADSIP